MTGQRTSSIISRPVSQDLSVVLTDDRMLVRAGRAVRLSVKERDVVAMLLARDPDAVDFRDLERAFRSSAEPDLRSMPKKLMPLRRRLAVVGLALRCQQRVGYTLEVHTPQSAGLDEAASYRSNQLTWSPSRPR